MKPASQQAAASQGMLLTVYGSGLASVTATAPSGSLPFTLGGVRARVNGVDAALAYVSPSPVKAGGVDKG